MSEDMADTPNPGSDATRREALRALGAGTLLAVLGLASPGASADAQEATPQSASTFEGRYAVIRIRQVKPEYSAEELARTVRDGLPADRP